MTPTEQAADRVKAVSALIKRPPLDDVWLQQSVAMQLADDHETLLSALTALQARAEEAERRVEEMEQADSRWVIRFSEVREASGIGYAPMLSEVPAAIRAKLGGYEFVCALMVAAAENLTGERSVLIAALERTSAQRQDAVEAAQPVWSGEFRALQERVGELEVALKPFAAFAQDNTEADPSSPGYGIWSGNRCEGERIKDWFGPTDFHRTALLTPPLEQE